MKTELFPTIRLKQLQILMPRRDGNKSFLPKGKAGNIIFYLGGKLNSIHVGNFPIES
jgi:hypothetical protein